MTAWLIYGANGYSGRLIAAAAVAAGLRPILAGRGPAVAALAAAHGLDCRRFALDDGAIDEGLRGCRLLLNCAGPFSATAAPLMQGCLRQGVHYLDITGEIDIFCQARALDQAAAAKGVLLCPGVGFDVVPTDCLAAALKEALPGAVRLALAFDSRSPLSPGTARTMVEGLAQGGKVRRGGRIIDVPFAYDVRRIDFGRGAKTAVSIPWGDVATAYFSTGIPDVTVYVASSSRAARRMGWMNRLRPLLRLSWVQALMKRRVKAAGPDAAKRAERGVLIWGEAGDRSGERRVARLETPNGYSLTVDAALAICRHVLDQPPATGGYRTPSQLLGWRFVESLPGVGRITIG